jgi:hypothetical protein
LEIGKVRTGKLRIVNVGTGKEGISPFFRQIGDRLIFPKGKKCLSPRKDVLIRDPFPE